MSVLFRAAKTAPRPLLSMARLAPRAGMSADADKSEPSFYQCVGIYFDQARQRAPRRTPMRRRPPSTRTGARACWTSCAR